MMMEALRVIYIHNRKGNVMKADKVYVNGKVYTVNENRDWAEAVAVKDGKIVFVGSDSDAKA